MTAGLIVVLIAWAIDAVVSVLVSIPLLAIMAYLIVTGLIEFVRMAFDLVRDLKKELSS